MRSTLHRRERPIYERPPQWDNIFFRGLPLHISRSLYYPFRFLKIGFLVSPASDQYLTAQVRMYIQTTPSSFGIVAGRSDSEEYLPGR